MKVFVLDDYEDAARTCANWNGLDVQILHDYLPTDELVRRVGKADALVLMRERSPITRDLLAQLPQLKLIVTTGPRNAAIDMEACEEFGITVSCTGGGPASAAELTWALILAASLRIPQALQAFQSGRWSPGTLGRDLAGQTLGVIGLGRLGSNVARYGNAFDMNVLAWSPNLTEERAAVAGAQFVSKDELLQEADVITLHMVLSPSTQHLIGLQELQQMKPTALLVNTSRAGLIDTRALLSACHEGRIGGAAIDVYDQEPITDPQLLEQFEGLLTTPHIGFVTQETFKRWYGDAVEAIHAFVRGAPIRELRIN